MIWKRLFAGGDPESAPRIYLETVEVEYVVLVPIVQDPVIERCGYLASVFQGDDLGQRITLADDDHGGS